MNREETIDLSSVSDDAIRRGPGRPSKYGEPTACIGVRLPITIISELRKHSNMTEFVLEAIREKMKKK